ncbi:MAG: hypothetical protein HY925_09010 [Elusimicrobia bacterium]|nr:hypothetical protein [Elusimicrobiota bacterium]
MRNSPYYAGAPADWLLAGGASLAVVAALALAGPRQAAAALGVIGVASWLAHWPHLAASYYRLAFWRPHWEAYPWAVWAAPAVVLFGTFAAFTSPGAFAPAWAWLAVWWLSFHVAEQAAVLSEAYSRRAGRAFGARERACLRAGVFALAAWHVAALEGVAGPARLFGLELPSARFPAEFALLAAGAGASALAGWFALLLQGGAPAPIVLLPPAALAVWFGAAGRVAGAREALAVFHGAQYLLLCGACQVREQLEQTHSSDRLSETLRWLAIVTAGGLFAGAALPGAAALAGVDFSFAFAISWSSAQLYHFMVDAVLWRWEDPAMSGRVVGPAVTEAA